MDLPLYCRGDVTLDGQVYLSLYLFVDIPPSAHGHGLLVNLGPAAALAEDGQQLDLERVDLFVGPVRQKPLKVPKGLTARLCDDLGTFRSAGGAVR
jgi:hypothetical protein